MTVLITKVPTPHRRNLPVQIELAGNAWYFGTLYEKPVIGDPVRAVEYKDIVRANILMTVTYILALIPVGILLFITL